MLSRFLLFLSLAFVAGQSFAVPVAVITANPDSETRLAEGETTIVVTFDGSTSDPDGGEFQTFHWQGSGFDVVGSDPTFSRGLGAGTHEISLTVTTDIEASEPVTINYIVLPANDPNQIPEAVISASPLSGQAPLEVVFSSAGSTGDGDLSYAWNFGDGSDISNEENPQHAFILDGTYTVSLIVTDEDGESSGAATLDIVVNVNTEPTATFIATPQEGQAPLVVTFSSAGSTGDGDLTYAWDFDDGGISNAENPTHTFATDGVYAVSLVITDEDGDVSQPFTRDITVVENILPQAFFTADTLAGQAPLTVNFSSAGSTGDGDLAYAWDFADGSGISNLESPAHTFAEGNYTVSLIVRDEDNESSVAFTRVISVSKANQPPVANPDAVNVISGKEITISVLVNDDDENKAGLQVDSFTQSQNGTTVRIDGTKIKYQSNAGFTGTDTFKYVARDDEGLLSAEATVTIGVSRDNLPPQVTIEAPPFTNGGLQVELDGSATDPEGDLPLTYQWTQVSGEREVEIINADAIDASFLSPIVVERVTLTFRLTVTDSLGAAGSAEVDIEVGNVDPPVAVIDTPDLNVLEGSTVRLSGRGIFLGEELADSERTAHWEQVEIGDGPIVPISDNSQSEISFVAPEVDNLDGTNPELELKFQLNIVTQDIPAKSEIVTVAVGDNGIVGIEGYITTTSDQDEVPFGVKTPEGDLIALEPFKISNVVNNANRPRRTPIGLVDFEVKTLVNGTAVIEIKLTAPLPADYFMYAYSDENGWEKLLDQVVSYNAAKDVVIITLQDAVSPEPKVGGDSSDQAGVVKFRGGPGQESRPVTTSASVSGGAMGVWLLLLTALLKWRFIQTSKFRFNN